MGLFEQSTNRHLLIAIICGEYGRRGNVQVGE